MWVLTSEYKLEEQVSSQLKRSHALDQVRAEHP